ncbi:hypothetical protein JHK82_047624 [Glycine max]|nr:hypothetical protein JHK86_047511 [Glycine max]KAG5097770.1 hypothetical protein JHK82_047624 [Glycine max]KAG5102567.1 hypothetical protein JHK84_047536 [Glycine max]
MGQLLNALSRLVKEYIPLETYVDRIYKVDANDTPLTYVNELYQDVKGKAIVLETNASVTHPSMLLVPLTKVDCSITMIYLEGNYAIDLLAGQEHNIPLGIQQLEVPPFGLKFLLWIDFVGTIFPRRVHL